MHIKTPLRWIYNLADRIKLKNKNVTVIASNCCGACICHELRLRFNSPFVNLWLMPGDFLKYLKNIEHYNHCELEFIQEDGISYPVGKLDDIRIYFEHYSSEEECKRKWEERVARMDLSNCYVLFTDRDGCTYEQLKEFDQLPYRNKLVMCNRAYADIQSAVYIKGFENEACVGACTEYRSRFSIKKFYDDIQYVRWFNGKLSQ